MSPERIIVGTGIEIAEQAIGPDVPGGAFLGDEYTKLARGLRLPALVPCLGGAAAAKPLSPFRRL